ncbi:hypothetical protein BKA67DRAFT_657403 [Truncatella angustata]|uniref:Exonuclease domain-containing protein n=1 Tax=Truncatella angustata TaxID=152316 RepID=A0A9P8ZZV3_9PEZI|nr:uncharacterized protein BKA67DRAFT_657403 [Truncatella angustata]KAH6655465.1 hypothetical protein BKA67DRAFT_657403 [Truncatella angustata]
MAASLGILKSLPCPAGKNCTAFQCLFRHPSDDAAEPAKTDESIIEPSLGSADAQDSPRKRIKVSIDIPNTDEKVLKQVSAGSAKPQTSGNEKVVKAMSVSARISPPPVQRKRTLPDNRADKSGNTLVSRKATFATSSQQSTAKSPVQLPIKAAPSKPETLNPRHLKKSPAKHDMRWQIVKLLHAQYERLNNELKKVAPDDESFLIMSRQQLITKTLNEEEEVAINKPTMYGNILKNKIKVYTKMAVEKWKDERLEDIKRSTGDTSALEEAHKVIVTGLTPVQEVEVLRQLLSPLKGLEQFGYISTVPKNEDIEKARQAVEASGNVEVCDRCTRRFTVYPGRREEDGALASGGPCVHHPGKTYFIEGPPGDRLARSSSSKKWRCCDQTVGDTDGCVTGKHHVFKTTDPNRLASVLQFAETPPNPDAPEDRAVCFDCEMGYTVYGMELIRLTALSWPSGEELLDVLVYPVGEPIDLNTRYSGVRTEDMAVAERWKPGDNPMPTVIPSGSGQLSQRKLKIVPSPKDARDLFFKLISPDTPLVGHAIENDLNTLRIVHPMVVDTVLLFPHQRGLPIRNGLKWLTETMLGRKIQVTSNDEDELKGHDSAEDARATGELVRLKIRNEWRNMQMKGWTWADDGKLKAPDDIWTVVGAKKTKTH